MAVGGDFAGDHGEAGGDERFASDAARGVLRENGVEDGVGDLVGDLVGMPSVTDSDVNRWRPLRLMRVELLHVARAPGGRGKTHRLSLGLARKFRGSGRTAVAGGAYQIRQIYQL